MRTDDPDLRFAPGSVLLTEPAPRGPLTVEAARWHSGTLLLTLARPDGTVLADREEADALRNTQLLVPVAELPPLDDPESFYDHQLVGLAAELPDGTPVGQVTAVRHEGTELLVVRRPEGGEVLVPFVTAIVPTVDVAAGRLVVDPPEGLLDL